MVPKSLKSPLNVVCVPVPERSACRIPGQGLSTAGSSVAHGALTGRAVSAAAWGLSGQPYTSVSLLQPQPNPDVLSTPLHHPVPSFLPNAAPLKGQFAEPPSLPEPAPHCSVLMCVYRVSILCVTLNPTGGSQDQFSPAGLVPRTHVQRPRPGADAWSSLHRPLQALRAPV